MQVGREVTFDQLISYLWSDDPPRTARSVIQVQISHLRRAFPGMISTTSGGYLADVEPDRVDLHRFRRLREEAGTLPPEEALGSLARALECWRGVPFSGVGSEHLYYSVVSPLLEERWTSVAQWASCALELGRASEVVAYLTPIAREEPLRERIHHLLITALWRSGERASALSAYEEIRSRLADELGVDPDPKLSALHTQILRADSSEQASPKAVGALSWSRKDAFVVRNDLPRDIPDFAGRDSLFGQLLEFSSADSGKAKVCVVTGSGGSGKTTIAVRAGHEIAEEYADGQLFIDLYGYTSEKDPLDPLAALGALLRAVGVDPQLIPEELDERSALWRATLMGRRLLVILDNANSYAQVSPLLPSSPGSLTIITSRNDLSGLSGARYLPLGTLDEESSLELFAQILGADRVTSDPKSAAEVVKLCGGLPLALRVVAARMLSRPRWTFAHVIRRLGEQDRRFQELQIDGQSVEVAIDLSYQSLAEELHEAFLLLGSAFGQNIDLHGAAALLGVLPEEADEVLQDLVGVCLLDEPHADVYRFHDLIGDFARQRARTDIAPARILGARQRHAEYFTGTTRQAADLLGGPRNHGDGAEKRASRYHVGLTNRAHAEEWFDLHQDNIVSVVEYFAARGEGDEAWRLADSVWRFYALRGRLSLLLESHERALEANDGQGNERGRAVMLIGMGIAYCISGYFNRSLEALREAKDALAELQDEWGMVRALSNLAMVYERTGRFRNAIEAIQEVLKYASSLGSKEVEALQWSNLAVLRVAVGDYEDALRCGERALLASTGPAQEENRAYVKRVMGEGYAYLGDVRRAHRELNEALEISDRLQLVGNQIYVHNSLGIAHRTAGRFDEAVLEHRKGLELGEESGDRSGDAEILTDLGVTFAAAGRDEQAAQALERALVIASERDERYIVARASLALGRLPEPVVECQRARELLAEAAKTFEELGLAEDGRDQGALEEG